MEPEMISVNIATTSALSEEHAETLATKWWTAEKFRQHGVPCREGAFTDAETEIVRTSIREYREARNLSEEEAEDLIFGVNKQEGFWAHVARAVFPRRVRSVYDHVQRVYHPLKNKGKWTGLEDAQVQQMVEHGHKWGSIAEALERPAEECRNRYQKCIAYKGTRRQGSWSSDEEARLTQIMQDLGEEGKTTDTLTNFWEVVAERMDNMRTAHQCRNKWIDSLYSKVQNGGKTPRWSHTDSYILIQKVASLDLDSEEGINWGTLPDDGWKIWTSRKLQQRWACLKKTAHTPGATHRDIVQRLSASYSPPLSNDRSAPS